MGSTYFDCFQCLGLQYLVFPPHCIVQKIPRINILISFQDCFWALGACLEVLLAALIVPVAGWRWLLALSAFPSLIFVFAVRLWVPESARYNVAIGKNDVALETLERIARINDKPMLLGRLIVDDDLQFFQSFIYRSSKIGLIVGHKMLLYKFFAQALMVILMEVSLYLS